MAKTKKLGDLVNQTVTLSAPLSGTANLTDTLNFSITKANTTTDGYVSATDWNIFNNKQDALGFTPYNATNPDGYISGITSGMVTTALGFTPYDSANPSGYITSSALSPYAPISNPTFTTAITTPILYGSSLSGGNLVISSTSNATKGSITIGNNNSEIVYLGNQQFAFTNVFLYGASNANSFLVTRVTASDTAPVYITNRGDQTTGIGGTVNTLSLITASTTKVKLFNSGNLTIQNGGTFTDNGFRLDVNGTGRFQNTLTLATGTTTIAPLKLTAGTNLTTPVNGSFEFDGTNLYFTVGNVRKTVTLI